MGLLAKYYTHTRLTSSGRLVRREIAAAKAFMMEQFPGFEASAPVSGRAPERPIQQLLVSWMKSGSHESPSSQQAHLAQACLRCYVSNAIEIACLELAHRFGLHQKLSSAEILSCVLDDFNPLQPWKDSQDSQDSQVYIPLAIKILQTFDPHQSSLSAWTRRLVIQHAGLNQLLGEYGIYIASDWAILNQAKPKRVQRLLSGMLTEPELRRAGLLLNSFHDVYRADRLQQRFSVMGQRCLEPNETQIQRMIQALQTAGMPITPASLLQELHVLATYLRRAKCPLFQPLDQMDYALSSEPASLSSEEVFLTKYREASQECLFHAIQEVLHQKFVQLQNQNPERAAAFLKALLLFFLQKKSMGEIATLVGLKQQFQVSRLLKLKQIRLQAGQRYVSLMQSRLQDILTEDFAPDHFAPDLAQFNLEPLLREMSEQLIAEDSGECHSAHRHSKSLFSLCVCRCLKAYA